MKNTNIYCRLTKCFDLKRPCVVKWQRKLSYHINRVKFIHTWIPNSPMLPGEKNDHKYPSISKLKHCRTINLNRIPKLTQRKTEHNKPDLLHQLAVESMQITDTKPEIPRNDQGRALLLLQDGHLYCLMCSALAGVIFTHLPWNHFSQISHKIQNSSVA